MTFAAFFILQDLQELAKSCYCSCAFLTLLQGKPLNGNTDNVIIRLILNLK
jgi:hypothetical protein